MVAAGPLGQGVRAVRGALGGWRAPAAAAPADGTVTAEQLREPEPGESREAASACAESERLHDLWESVERGHRRELEGQREEFERELMRRSFRAADSEWAWGDDSPAALTAARYEATSELARDATPSRRRQADPPPAVGARTMRYRLLRPAYSASRPRRAVIGTELQGLAERPLISLMLPAFNTVLATCARQSRRSAPSRTRIGSCASSTTAPQARARGAPCRAPARVTRASASTRSTATKAFRAPPTSVSQPAAASSSASSTTTTRSARTPWCASPAPSRTTRSTSPTRTRTRSRRAAAAPTRS